MASIFDVHGLLIGLNRIVFIYSCLLVSGRVIRQLSKMLFQTGANISGRIVP